jgi:uncharacterized membrane protein YeaQ/YmgE (transglycosylase-associated protein family)
MGDAMNALALWWFLIYMLLVGMAAGWLAWVVLGKSKALMKGRKPNWGLLLVLGVIGSFVGGMASSLLLGDGLALNPSGMIGSVLGAVAVAAIYVGVKR